MSRDEVWAKLKDYQREHNLTSRQMVALLPGFGTHNNYRAHKAKGTFTDVALLQALSLFSGDRRIERGFYITQRHLDYLHSKVLQEDAKNESVALRRVLDLAIAHGL